jgi:hypothetical protein
MWSSVPSVEIDDVEEEMIQASRKNTQQRSLSKGDKSFELLFKLPTKYETSSVYAVSVTSQHVILSDGDGDSLFLDTDNYQKQFIIPAINPGYVWKQLIHHDHLIRNSGGCLEVYNVHDGSPVATIDHKGSRDVVNYSCLVIDDDHVIATGHKSCLTIISCKSWKIVTTVNTDTLQQYSSIVLLRSRDEYVLGPYEPDGERSTSPIAFLDRKTLKVKRVIPCGFGVWTFLEDPAGIVYCGGENGDLCRINENGTMKTWRIRTTRISGLYQRQNYLYCFSMDESVCIFDLRTEEVVHRFDFSGLEKSRTGAIYDTVLADGYVYFVRGPYLLRINLQGYTMSLKTVRHKALDASFSFV